MSGAATDDGVAGTTDKDGKGGDMAVKTNQPSKRKKASASKTGSKETATGKKPAAGVEAKKASGGRSKTAKTPRGDKPSAPGKKEHPSRTAPSAPDKTMTPTDASTTAEAENSQSLSWMSAQAASALKAVKANQAKKAEALLAKAEKPVPGRAGITELPEQTSDDLIAEYVEPEEISPIEPAMTAEAPESMPSPAPSRDVAGPDTVSSKTPAATQSPQAEVEMITAATVADLQQDEIDMTSETNTSETISPVDAGEAPAAGETVIAPQVRQSGLPVRPIITVVFMAMLAFGGYRYWHESAGNRHVVATPPESNSGSVLESNWDNIQQPAGVTVVGTTPPPDKAGEFAKETTPPVIETTQPGEADQGERSAAATAKASQEPAMESEVEPQTPATAPVHEPVPWQPAQIPAGAPEPAAVVASEPPQEPEPATTATTPPAETTTRQQAPAATAPAAEPAPLEPVQATAETPEPPVVKTSEPQQTAQPAEPVAATPPAAVAPPARQARPQPYGTPGYGYYPRQQPNWQQPYYRPAYPQQYPSR